eukprot:CAMPEP_0113554952 /NCGR_PEP_ID=MMETSP0015_2-20120614/16441_1 /TAXON_ID=2838 /ORGANISM="Odontella" /LENGTH=1207 /DNA_ID=CAMNT_0000456163 /DNA_START=250 /DNA_END=3873 /DNA_ORIENTATION=+ /assembly_acc=CAM_ASM_000160
MATLAASPLVVGGIPTPSPAIATASGLLALLTEPEPTLRAAALTRLLACVDQLWHEVAESLPDLEAIAEDPDADESTRRTAAAVASRVFFHLEEPVQALRLALEGGEENFDVVHDRRSAYVECLVGAAIDAYVKRRKAAHDEGIENGGGGGATYGAGKKKTKKKTEDEEEEGAGEEDAALDEEKLSRVVQLMFERCYADGRYGHALGVAFEARETDKVREILGRCRSDGTDPSDVQSTLRYALDSAVGLIAAKSFRNEVLGILADHLKEQFEGTTGGGGLTSTHRSAAVALCQCRQLLGESGPVAGIVTSLLDGTDDESLLGLQLCFDLVDTGDQRYVDAVAAGLPEKGGAGAGAASAEVLGETAAAAGSSVEVSVDGAAAPAPAAASESAVEAVASSSEGEAAKPSSTAAGGRSDQIWERFDNARRVLTGGFTSELALSFLHKNSDSDGLIMDGLKKALEERGASRNSVLHNNAVAAHAYLNAGTTNDAFLRDHLDWMRKASNWAKFSATASLGVIHAGHTTEAMTLLEPYLPPSTDADDPSGGHPTVTAAGGYAEGGSLYALGLIHGSHAGSSSAKRKEASDFLRNHLRNSHANEVISHGASLGVGLTAFGTTDLEVVNELKELLYTDSAVAGEAAGTAIGMVLVGSGAGNARTSAAVARADREELSEIVSELKNYARETQHEKIIRGISLGLALVQYGQEENADAVIEEMRGDRDPILRYGAQYALALAYCGTGSNRAIRILLHTAVSDVSDDVRMAAVIALAFVLYETPERVPQLVKLLLESFNPHVRYGSCVAVGIAMAGTGDADAIALLEPMLEDMTDFVRQGALLGTAMIYMQQSDTSNGRKIKAFRERLSSTVSEKHQSTLTKMGAILSTGILDAGGRNCSLVLGSRTGFTKMTSAVGLVLWLQHWHWYPMMHMFSLALTPTFTIGLNKDFKYPKGFEIQCNSKPSQFAYPKRLEEKKKMEKKRVETVTLSTTAKNKARLARKKAKEEAEHGGGAADMDVEKKDEEKEEEEKKKDEEKKDQDAEEGMDVDGEDKDAAKEGEDKDAAAAAAAEGGKKKKKKREPEPTSFRLSNPCRITKAQAEVCAFELKQRYRPIRPEETPFGVVMLTDSTPDEEDEDLGVVKEPSLDAEDEADPPEPFEWAPPGHPEAEDATSATDAKDKAEGDGKEDSSSGGGDKPKTDDSGDGAVGETEDSSAMES